MKYIGILLLNFATFGAGIAYLLRIKERCVVASELIQMADFMNVELSFSADNSKKIIKKLAAEENLSHLSFLKSIDLENINITTVLKSADNERVNSLFKNLGCTDISSMIKIIDSFKENMTVSKAQYDEYYRTHSRLGVAFGVLSGLAVTVVLI